MFTTRLFRFLRKRIVLAVLFTLSFCYCVLHWLPDVSLYCYSVIFPFEFAFKSTLVSNIIYVNNKIFLYLCMHSGNIGNFIASHCIFDRAKKSCLKMLLCKREIYLHSLSNGIPGTKQIIIALK